MKPRTWRKHHKWSGLVLCFFLLMLCLSGIALNHRPLIAEVNVSRSLLPPWYHFRQWNNGLLRGTLAQPPSSSPRSGGVLIYGAGGVFLVQGDTVADFNQGLPTGADRRAMRAVVRTDDERLFALSQFGLFTRAAGAEEWTEITMPTEEDERLSDLTLHDDTLVAVGRSRLYIATLPQSQVGATGSALPSIGGSGRGAFTPLTVQAAPGEPPRVSLFKTLWRLHSGELFGLVGKLVADAIALVLVFLAITGVICWLLPKWIKRQRRRKQIGGTTARVEYVRRRSAESKQVWSLHSLARTLSPTRPETRQRFSLSTFRFSLYWHNRLGRLTIILTALIIFTGWCLRPPLMVPLVLTSTPPLSLPHSGESEGAEEAWHDKLRALRYDEQMGDWLLFTADGFYALPTLDGVPVTIDNAPAVSVMGINVWERNEQGDWLVGSFSGMNIWQRSEGRLYDYFTLLPIDPSQRGAPFGKIAVSGYSAHLSDEPQVVTYGGGTTALLQPAELSRLPMSLWNVALEVHTGRIYFGNAATYFWIFLVGLLALWCLWSGWKMRRK